MPVSKLGQRRQGVIPKTICDALALELGDFVEVQRVKGTIVIKPKKLVDSESENIIDVAAILVRDDKTYR